MQNENKIARINISKSEGELFKYSISKLRRLILKINAEKP